MADIESTLFLVNSILTKARYNLLEVYVMNSNVLYAYVGPGWMSVSNEAKDLVTRMLTVNPENRISVEQCLNHPWLVDAVQPIGSEDSSPVMGDQYCLRIKNLVLQSKLKRCFVDNCIRNDHFERRKLFKSELPFLDNSHVEENANDWNIKYDFIFYVVTSV